MIRKFIKSDVNANNNKFWTVKFNDNYSVDVSWGRVGTNGDHQTKLFYSQNQAESFINKKISEKKEKGYIEIETIDSNEMISTENYNLEKIAKSQIRTDSETINLIDILTKTNIHNIISSTTIKYNIDSGLFSTPLGIITKSALTTAQSLLNEISEFVFKQSYDDDKYHKILNEYLMLIPQKVGRKLNPHTLFTTNEDIKKQNDILDSLLSSIDSYDKNKSISIQNNENNNISLSNVFSCELKTITDKKILKYIENKYYSTKQHQHSSSSLKLKKIYSIVIDKMVDDFNSKGKIIGNIKELWHGTKTANLLSILKMGLIIPPKNDSHVTGRMYGNGVYFSDQSTKALNYSYGYWSGSRDNNCFMFIADVAMGKEYIPNSSYENLPKSGYDSTFAKAHQSGVINNEMIVYNLYQINLKYLVEFN